MSFSFYVRSPTLPRFGEVVDALPFADVRCREEDEEEDDFDRGAHWPDRHLHFYRDGLSTCAVAVYWEDGEFEVRVFAFAAAEEYELAVELAAYLAGRSETGIRPEDADEELPVEEVRGRYGADWAAGQVASLFASLRSIVRDSEGSCRIPGAVRQFYIGRRLLGELESAGPPEEFAARVIAAMRRVQYVDPEEYFFASAMEVQPRDSDRTFTVAAWAAEIRYLFPDVDYLALVEEGSIFFIPYRALPEVAAGRWEWLDESQTLVEPFSAAEWPGLLARARRHEVEPEPKRPPSRRREGEE